MLEAAGVLSILPDLEDEIREKRESKKGDGGWQAGSVGKGVCC